MELQFKVWLYGTRAVKSKKTFFRLPDDALSKAKAFHLFYRKSSRGKWRRVTVELEVLPSSFRSKADKQIYIDSYISAIEQEITRELKPKPPKPKPPKTPKPTIKKEIELPPLPKEPRVTLTKKQFNAQMSRILFDELDLENLKWSAARINNFINKLWRSYSHAPHLITSEQFRRSLVSKELKRIKDKELRKKQGELEESFRQELLKREVSLDPAEVGGEVKVTFKEVFNSQYLPPALTPEEEEELTREEIKSREKEELTFKTLQDGFVVDKERQAAFAQVHVEYDKLMVIGKDQLLGEDKIAELAFDKTRKDIEKLFDQAMEKGLFKESDVPEYSFRLLVPLVDGKGDIPGEYFNKKGKKRSGHGFSTVREKIKNKKDLKKVLDDLFSAVRPALAKYIKLNNAAGFMIAGFSIERLIR